MTNRIALFWSVFCLVQICFCIEGCIESERLALLQFKNGLTDPSDRLADWVPHSSDCCTWTGVVCQNLSSHVLELHLRTLSLDEYLGPDEIVYPSHYEQRKYEQYRMKSAFGGNLGSSLLQLKHLRYLDLSCNNFRGLSLPEFIGSMQSLRYLNLSDSGFGGVIPPQLGNLSTLNYLNLRYNFLEVHNLDWVTPFSSLQFLDLSWVDLSRLSVKWLEVMNSLPSLVELHLSFCFLPNFNPSSLPIFNFSSLTVLDLSDNDFGGPIPNSLQNLSSSFRGLDLSYNLFNSSIPNWLYDFTRIHALHVRDNLLRGQVSSRIGNLTSLVSLDLSYNNGLEFKKGIPNSFQNLCKLRSLALSGIKLSQEINDIIATMSRCASSILQLLDLNNCQLSGHLSDDFARFKNLVYFDISYNSISGPIPVYLGNLNKLKSVYIDYNYLEGEVSELHFTNLTRLADFAGHVMKNKITLRVSPNWIPPLQVEALALGSWIIGPQFPNWLRRLKHLTYLDLSNCEIMNPFPIWFWDLLPNCYYLNFSHNHMVGSIPNISLFSEGMPMIDLIDLSSNKFSGVLPHFPTSVIDLDISHNSFSGSAFNLLCHKMNVQKHTKALNLEGNLLSGEIPDCWRSWSYLVAVRLSNNSFSGNIPHSIGTLTELQSLHLRNNNLLGEMPSLIQTCTQLFLLDISENNLAGKIPTWIENKLSELIILNLHSNKFDGYLPKELCHLASLHILDLSHNHLSGTIPSCFGNFSGMANRNDTTGSLSVNSFWLTTESTMLLMKGIVLEYSTNLRYVRSIDLSNNNLYGEIPMEITSIVELQSLNLSHNALTGRIPDNIGDMKGLEAIDMSHNKLSGEIPESLSYLSFLGMLDLSYNNLSGRIPTGTQLQSFGASNFMGNHLCGLPLTNNCTSNNNVPVDPHTEEDDANNGGKVDVWFYESMAFGFVLGFWSAVGSLVFIRTWRNIFFHSVYHLREMIL